MKTRESKSFRFLLFAIALMLLACLLSSPAWAAPWEQYTKEELTEVYSAEETLFLQWFSDGYSFKTSIPNGQETPGMVSIEFPPELTWSLERDGAPMAYQSGEYLFQPGLYVFTISSPGGIYAEYSFAITDPVSDPGSSGQAIPVILGHSYQDGRFVYTFKNGRSFSANVPNGGIANYGVIMQTDGELICVLTCNGKALLYQPGDVLTEDGYYHMRIISPMTVEAPDLSEYSEDYSGSDSVDMAALEREAEALRFSEEGLGALEIGEIYETVFSFRIITKPTRDLAVFNLPGGFEFASIYLDGNTVEPSGTRSHRITKDGGYVVSLRDAVSTAPEFVSSFTVKNSPPSVRLEGATSGFSSGGPVTVHAGEGVTLTVYRNNMQTSASGSYSERGRYAVVATDEAGNTSRLQFEIVFAPPRRLILVALLLLLAAGIGYVIHARRSMIV